MAKFEEVLNLPVDDLKERRRVLEQELSKVVVELVSNSVKEAIAECLKEDFEGQTIDVARLTWDFYPESDDEGGSDWWVTDVSAYDSEGNYVEMDDFSYKQLSWNKEYTYEIGLGEAVREILSDYRDDLYDEYITEINL